MDLIVRAAIVLAYLTLVLELTLVHVPSIVSFRSIWIAPKEVVLSFSESYQRVFRLNRVIKLLLFVPPLVIIYVTFLFPIGSVFFKSLESVQLLLEPNRIVQWFAVALILSGRLLGFITALTMIRNAGSRRNDGLLTTGPFRCSRNPGLTGMFMMFGGLWLLLPTTPLLCGILVYYLYMNFKVRMEEDYLGRRFGAEFDAYRRSTGRYLL